MTTDGWSSDWEKLFAKCAIDKEYLEALGAALQRGDDATIQSLLDSIGVAGTDDTEKVNRVSALKTAFSPMADVARGFGESFRVAG